MIKWPVNIHDLFSKMTESDYEMEVLAITYALRRFEGMVCI